MADFQDLPPHVSALGSAGSAVGRLVGGGLLLMTIIAGLLFYGSRQEDAAPEPFPRTRTESAGGVPTDVPSARPSGLLVRTAADGATIHVDGDSVGTAPEWQGTVAEGDRWVRIVTPAGRVVADTLVLVRAGAQTALDVRPLGLRAAAPAPSRPPSDRPPVATAVQTTGSIRVTSSPAGATVRIDGRAVGQTPLRINALQPGPHDVAVGQAGYETTALQAVVVGGSDSEVAVSLRPDRTSRPDARPTPPAPVSTPESTGNVEVLVRPWGRIVIDGVPRTQETDVLYRTVLPVGEHRIEALHPTLGSKSTTVRVTSSGRIHVEFDLDEDLKD